MKQHDNVTIDVFKDSVTPFASLEYVIEGIERVRQYAGRIAIHNIGTEYFLDPDMCDVQSSKDIDWPESSADLIIVASSRRLSNKDPLGGKAWVRDGKTPLGKRLSITRITSPEQTALAVEHEIGHMLTVARRGAKTDGSGHCVDSDCSMYWKPKMHACACTVCADQYAAQSAYIVDLKNGKRAPSLLLY